MRFYAKEQNDPAKQTINIALTQLSTVDYLRLGLYRRQIINLPEALVRFGRPCSRRKTQLFIPIINRHIHASPMT